LSNDSYSLGSESSTAIDSDFARALRSS